MSRCKKCGAELVCPVCAASERGSVKSAAKRKAARANGKLGGRPRKKRSSATPAATEGEK